VERDALRDVVASDAYAATFQSLGQYRTAILKHIDNRGAAESAHTQYSLSTGETMNENKPDDLAAARKHLEAMKAQSDIILNQQAEIDRLNAHLIDKVDESKRLREQLAALEDRLRFPGAPMNQSTGMRCGFCCAPAGHPHVPGCQAPPDDAGTPGDQAQAKSEGAKP
jgi:hypothetical protein